MACKECSRTWRRSGRSSGSRTAPATSTTQGRPARQCLRGSPIASIFSLDARVPELQTLPACVRYLKRLWAMGGSARSISAFLHRGGKNTNGL